MTLVITHSTVTGAVADTTALVDGPKWDANHTLTGAASPSQGGTGVANNDSSTITISGSFGITFTVSAATSLTFPTSGTLATTSNKLSDFAATTSAELKTVISDETGSGALVFANTPTLVTPLLGIPTSGTLTNCTGLPISTGVSGLGTGIAAALAVNTGSAGAPVLFNGAGGTPTSLTGTNISGTAASLTAGNATNTAITDDTSTNATMFPTWVTTASSNQAQKVSSSKLYFNPSIPTLTLRRSSTAISTPGSTTGLFVQGGDTGEARIDIAACASDAVVAFNRLNGTFASTTKVVSGDQIMGLPSGGIDTNGATTFQQGGSISSYATADWSATSHPTEFRFYTIPTSSTSLLLSGKILDSGGAWFSRNSTAPNSVAAGTPVLQLQSSDGADNYTVHDSYGTGFASYDLYRTARGTAASFTASQSGDALGGFAMIGATAAGTFPNPFPLGTSGGSFVLAQAKETWSSSAQGSNLQFYTTPLTTNVVSIALCCQPSGGASIGTGAIAKDYGLGNLYLAGGFASTAPPTKTGNYTMTVADSSLIFNGSGSITLTLLSAVTYSGREIILKNIAAFTVVSASSNVVPQAGGAAGTAILAATAGKWAHLKSDGTNWQIMMSN